MPEDKHAKVAPARRLAFAALRRMTEENLFAEDVLDELLPEAEERDRRLTAAITYGVIRHRLTLDHILRAFSRSGKPPRPLPLLEILRMALFQILFLDRVPPHAAISQAVELAKDLAPEAGGYANGLLRSIQNALGPSRDEDPCAILPRPGGRSIEFDRQIFPSPENTVDYLSLTTSHPPWLIRRWIRAFGAEQAQAVCLANNYVLPTTLRVNTLQTTREQFQKTLAGANYDVTAGVRPEALHARRTLRIDGLPGFAEGQFSVQDEAAMAVAPMLAEKNPQRVMDLCAGVGGKATHLAELLRDAVPVVAVDISREQLTLLRQNISRLRLGSVAPVQANGTRLPFRPVFEAILLDVPCTNSGVLARRPEARWRLTPEDFTRCAVTQMALLKGALPLLMPGGRLLYSTCSIDAEENEEIIEAFVSHHFGFRVEATRLDLPTDRSGGGFRAVLVSSN